LFLINIKIKIIIIIVLKSDLRVVLGQSPDHGSSNIKIKITIIIVSIPTWESNHDKAQISGRESQHRLNEVNVWIKFIIIIFLKPDLEVEQVKDLNYRSKGSIKVNQIKKKNQSNLLLIKKFKK
jgi:hypothetical protein